MARFCRIALGSANELEYHLLLAKDLKFLKAPEYESLSGGVGHLKRMLSALIEKLTADS